MKKSDTMRDLFSNEAKEGEMKKESNGEKKNEINNCQEGNCEWQQYKTMYVYSMQFHG